MPKAPAGTSWRVVEIVVGPFEVVRPKSVSTIQLEVSVSAEDRAKTVMKDASASVREALMVSVPVGLASVHTDEAE